MRIRGHPIFTLNTRMGRQIAAITRIDSIVTLPRRNDRFCLTSLSIVKFRFTTTHHAEFLFHHFPTLLRRLRSARMVETVTIAEDCCTRLNALHYSLNFLYTKGVCSVNRRLGFSRNEKRWFLNARFPVIVPADKMGVDADLWFKVAGKRAVGRTCIV